MRRIEVPDKDVLYTLYHIGNKSLSDIGVEFNTTPMTVLSWLRKYKIPIRPSNRNVFKELRNTSFSKKQIDLIVGSVLGDGCLRIPKHGKNAIFTEKHSERQREYLEWKRDILLPFCKKKFYIEELKKHVISGVRCKVSRSYKLSTISHPDLTVIRNKFYVENGVKVLPIDFENILNEFILAVWFMDDGSLVWKPRYYRFDLHTESFDYKYQVMISRAINKFFGGKIMIIPRQHKNGERYYISLRGKDHLEDFLPTLHTIAPKCMKNKFKTTL